jgi:uncharacterized circularly permuted ATP-grasp superfamily protein/uncharacterized alpha-E superfamily protein
MTVMPRSPLPGYRAPTGGYDELVDGRGEVRPAWRAFAHAFTGIDPGDIIRRRRAAERLLVAEGASHVVHGDGHDQSRPWPIDPVPYVIDAREWAALAAGLSQRARLHDGVLADLYGPARLLADGTLPAELVLGSPTFQPAAHGVAPAGGRHLTVYGADLVRDASGCFHVVREHTDAPSGAGYALLYRLVVSRLLAPTLRSASVAGHGAFFAALRAALATLAPETDDGPRTVVLTPGLGHPSYFEHSYLASHLGYTLVEGGDLAVRHGRVWLRALGGLEPVDVVLRRSDDAASDPLELADSIGGVPGLLQTARLGNVGLANALGSGVTQHLGLQQHLAALCQRVLGEPLLLPSAQTNWLGARDAAGARGHVIANLDRYVLHDVARDGTSAFGALLDDEARARWLRRINEMPERVVAQHRIGLATTPVLTDRGIGPGYAVLRAFVVLGPAGPVVLPGGLAKVVDEGTPVVSQHGGMAKDVWVLEDGATRPITASVVRPQLAQIDLRSSLPTRAAEALYWLGRNGERAEAQARLARTVLATSEQEPALAFEAGWREPVRAALAGVGGRWLGAPDPSLAPHDQLARDLASTLAPGPGSVLDSLNHLARTAASIREYLSSTTWRVVAGLEGERAGLEGDEHVIDPVARTEALDRVLLLLLALGGLTQESTVRGPGWRFLDLGRRLERALALLSLLQAAVSPVVPDDARQPLGELVLTASESLVAYRRRHRSDVVAANLCDLLITDDTNPRSLAFQLDRISEHLISLPTRPATAHHLRLVEEVSASIFTAPWPRPGARTVRHDDFDHFVVDARRRLEDLSIGIRATWFSDATAAPAR